MGNLVERDEWKYKLDEGYRNEIDRQELEASRKLLDEFHRLFPPAPRGVAVIKHPSIVCPRCGLRSYHPRDIEEQYCVSCHDFHENMREATMPNFCFDCGAYLMGGATLHKRGCSVRELIDKVLDLG